MLKLTDVVIHNHRESKEREFFITIKIKEEDCGLNEKEFIREACRNGMAFDLVMTPGAASTEVKYEVNQETGEVLTNPDQL